MRDDDGEGRFEQSDSFEPFNRFMHRVFGWLALITVGLALCGVGFYFQIEDNGNRARDAEKLTQRIQSERTRNIEFSCRDTNARHDAAVQTYAILLARVPPERQAEASQGRAAILSLIEALVPRRDCDAFTRAQVAEVP